MKRRAFIEGGLLAAGALATTTDLWAGATPDRTGHPSGQAEPFTLKYAPTFGLFEEIAGPDPLAQIEFAAEQGFTGWEDTVLVRKPVDLQERIAETLQRLGMSFGEFVAHMTFEDVTFARKDEATWQHVLGEVEAAVAVAQRMNTRFVHVVLGMEDRKLAYGYQMANAIELLRRCVDILAPHGLILIMEPMNHRIDHPGMFLHATHQAYELCKAVNSPSCKILFDMYHVQIQEGNLIPNIDLCWDEIGYFQIGDTPGRDEPTSGEINYKKMFQHIYDRGYDGFLGLEHGTSRPGAEGERAVVEAYRACDPVRS